MSELQIQNQNLLNWRVGLGSGGSTGKKGRQDMRSKFRSAIGIAGSLVYLVGNLSQAQESTNRNDFIADLFSRGRYEATLTSGALFSPFIADGGRPVINYTMSEVQLGYMLTDVQGRGWLRGNWELTAEVFGSGIFKGPGTYIAGSTIWGRYNFIPAGARFTPFLQAGAGVTTTDIDHRIDGQDFNFNLNLGLGFRYFLARNWSLNLEYRYQHISNANTGPHNLGINSHGPILGISYLF
jgi:opacity protein-like surface antigen